MPTETSFPFTSVSYPAAAVAAALATATGTGVVLGSGSLLAVAASAIPDMNMNVQPGAAWVQGVYYSLTGGNKVLSVPSNATGNPRIDRVVLGLDYVHSTVTLYVKAGTPAASPAPPALEQDATLYEISLAQVTVAASATTLAQAVIQDERAVAVSSVTRPNAALPIGTGAGTVIGHAKVFRSSSSPLTVPTLSSVAVQSPTGANTAITGMTSHIYVKVTALDASSETVGSAAVTATPSGAQDVLVSWSPITGAVQYRVYVSTGVSDPGDASRFFWATTSATSIELGGALPASGPTVPTTSNAVYTVPVGCQVLVSRVWGVSSATGTISVNGLPFINIATATYAAVLPQPVLLASGALIACPQNLGLWGYVVGADPNKTPVAAALGSVAAGSTLYALAAGKRLTIQHAYATAAQTLYDAVNGSSFIHFKTPSEGDSSGSAVIGVGQLGLNQSLNNLGLPQPVIVPGTAAGANVVIGQSSVPIAIFGYIETTPFGQ